MDDERKRMAKRATRAAARERVRDSFPIAGEALRELFDALDAALAEGCDHTSTKTRAWLSAHGHPVESTLKWLAEHGGYCDCEVLANVEGEVDEALADCD